MKQKTILKPINTPELAKVTLGDLLPAAMTFVVLTVTLALGSQVLDELGDEQAVCDGGLTYNSSSNDCFNLSNASSTHTAPTPTEFNVTKEGRGALLTIGEKLGILATVIVLGAVLAVLIALIRMRFT